MHLLQIIIFQDFPEGVHLNPSGYRPGTNVHTTHIPHMNTHTDTDTHRKVVEPVIQIVPRTLSCGPIYGIVQLKSVQIEGLDCAVHIIATYQMLLHHQLIYSHLRICLQGSVIFFQSLSCSLWITQHYCEYTYTQACMYINDSNGAMARS